MKYFFLLLIFASESVCFAQTVLTPAANTFEKKWIKKGTTEMACYAKSGTQWAPIGSFDITVREIDNRLLVSTLLKLNNSDSKWVDTSISELGSLKPVYRSLFTPDRNMVLHFGKEVSGYYLDKAVNKKTAVKELVSNDFFESYTYPYLLAALPLSCSLP